MFMRQHTGDGPVLPYIARVPVPLAQARPNYWLAAAAWSQHVSITCLNYSNLASSAGLIAYVTANT